MEAAADAGSMGGEGTTAPTNSDSGVSPDAGNFVPQPGAEGDDGSDTQEPGQDGKPKAKPAPTKYKLVRGGKDVEATLDDLQRWAGDDYEHEIKVDGTIEKLRYRDLVSRAQLGHAAFARMREAKQAEARYQSMERELLADPTSIFERAGVDAHQWAVQQVQEQIAREKAAAQDPHAFARQEAERVLRLERAKLDRENAAKAQQAARDERNNQRRAMYAALPQALGMKMNMTINGVIGQMLHDADKAGHTAEVQELAALAKAQFRRDVQSMVADMTPEQLRDLIGDSAMKRLRQSDVATKRAAEAAKIGIGGNQQAVAKKPAEGEPKLTPRQLLQRRGIG